MSNSPVRVAIFDLDGTLVDAFQDIAEAVNTPLRRRGLPEHSLDAIKSMVGDGAGRLIQRATEDLPREIVKEIHAEMLEKYRADPAAHAFAYHGIFDLLEDLLDWGIRMGVLSNKPHPMTLATCEQLGLTRYFVEIVGESGADTPRKPDPQALLAMVERMGASKVVFIGDGAADGLVAQAARLPFIACLWGTRTREQLAEFNPIAFAEKPSDLHALVLDALK